MKGPKERERLEMIQVAVLGYGTVGSGVVEVINTNSSSINKRQARKSTSNMCLTFGISG